MANWTETAEKFEAELKEAPDDPNCLYNLAMARMMTVETGEAPGLDTAEGQEIVASCEAMLDAVVEATAGGHGNARALLGRICMVTGRPDEAAGYYSDLLRDLDPSAGRTWSNVALNLMAILMKGEAYEDAQALGARWVEVRPGDPEAYNRLGLAWGVPGMEKKDRAACEKSVAAFARAVELGHPQAAGLLKAVQGLLAKL